MAAFSVSAGNGKPSQSHRDTKDGINNAVQKAIGLYSASTPKRRKRKTSQVPEHPQQNSPDFHLYVVNIPEKLKFERLDKFLRPFPFLKDNINLQVQVFEFPLTNKNPGARGLGPARVILEEKNDV